MTVTNKTFSEAVAARVEELGGKVSAIEKGYNLKPDAIRNVIRAGEASGPTLNRAQEICEALGIELYLGPSAAVRGMKPPPAEDHAASIADQFTFIEHFDVALSAGAGRIGENAKTLAPVAFRSDWLRSMYLSGKDCMVLRVAGDSMEPTLRDGDLALLDRRQESKLAFGNTYGLIDIDGEARVKRIEAIDEGLLLQSDNTDYAIEARLGEDANRVKIIGRVVWSGRKHEVSLRKPPRHDPPRKKSGQTPFKATWM